MNNKGNSMTIYDKLAEWRKERRLDQVKQTKEQILTNIMEEVYEAIGLGDASRQEAEWFVNYWLNGYVRDLKNFKLEDVSDEQFIDALGDIKVFITNGIEQYGYNAEMVDEEIYKEISSRKQCPIQAEEWAKGEFGDNKWRKDKKQNPKTLYKANIAGCKRC
jgi:hypothetical protein